MKIGIIGAGIFGISTALCLSKSFEVDLFEKNDDILQSASGINQYRLHRGYHYPRSLETAISSKNSELSFKKEFGDAIVKNSQNYYCISKFNSLTTRKQYLEFCIKSGLEFEEIELENVNSKEIDLCVKVKENLFDPIRLKKLCWKKLNKNNVNVFTKQNMNLKLLKSYDKIILATYANQNKLLESNSNFQKNYQFEICEKPVVKLPNSLSGKSIVIMDGPFMCVDPFGNSGNFVLGNVVHAIHKSNIGKYPQVPQEFSNLINRGVIRNPSITNFSAFIKSGSKFIPELQNAKHLGSMYTIRTVLPNLEKTDARPTLVTKLNTKIISVFSGKIGNCFDAAQKVYELIN